MAESKTATEAKEDLSSFIGKRRRYYTPEEVSRHNCAWDCWVSIFNKVYDITSLMQEYGEEHPLVQPMRRFAGKDISEWFDQSTGDVKKEFDKVTQLVLPVLPYGRFVHVAPACPVSDWDTSFKEPWWKDYEQYGIGSLSVKTRKIRILNTITGKEQVLEVCSEETIDEIQDRYVDYNSHTNSYTWKVLDGESFRILDMTKTLEENDVEDEVETFEKLNLGNDFFYVAVHLYYNDDLTEA